MQLGFDSPLAPTEVSARMLQCMSILATVLSSDDKQTRIMHLLKLMKSNWLRRGLTGKDRRGFVGLKPEIAIDNRI